MSIARVGATNAASASLTSAAGSAGDLIVWFAFRSTAATVPTVPSGVQQVPGSNLSGSTCAEVVAYEWASSSSAVSRTFTGATQMVSVRYAGVYGIGQTNIAAIASSNSMSYGALGTLQSATSWAIAWGAHRTASNVNTAPTGMSTITNGSVGTGPMLSVFDTNGNISSWSSQSVTVNATSGRGSGVLELLASPRVSVDVNGAGSETGATPTTQLNLTLNVGAFNAPNIILIAEVIFYQDAGQTITSVQWDATGTPASLTQISNTQNGNQRAELWAILAPSAGSKTLRVNFSANTTYCGVNGTAFFNADQSSLATTLYGVATANNASSSTVSQTTGTIATDDAAIQSLSASTHRSTNNQTLLVDLPTSGLVAQWARGAGAAITMTTTLISAGQWASIVAGILRTGGGGTTYNVSISESGSAADTVSNSATVIGAILEAASAADSPSEIATLLAAITEVGTAADVQTVQGIYNAAIAEAASAADAVNGGALFSASVSEAGAAADTTSSVATLPAAITEAGTAVDTVSSKATQGVTVSEAGSAVDSPSEVATLAATITEAGSAADTTNSTGIKSATVSEAASAADTTSSTAILAAAVTEAANAQDSETASAPSDLIIVETMNAQDTVSAQVVYRPSVSEAANAQDTTNAGTIIAAVIAEAGNAADVVSAAASYAAILSEFAAALDTVSGALAYNAAVVEAANAQDTVSSTEGPVIPPLFNILTGPTRTRILTGPARVRALTGPARVRTLSRG